MSHIFSGIYEYPHTPYMTKARPPSCSSVLNRLQAAADKLSALSQKQRDPRQRDMIPCQKAMVEINFNMVYDFRTQKYNYCDFRHKNEFASAISFKNLSPGSFGKSIPNFGTQSSKYITVVATPAGNHGDHRIDSFQILSRPSMVCERLLSMMIQNKYHNIQKIITSTGIEPTTLLGYNSYTKRSNECDRIQYPTSDGQECMRYNSTGATHEGDIARYYTSSYRDRNIPRYYTASCSERNMPRYYTSTQSSRNDIPRYYSQSSQNIYRQQTTPATEAFFISRYSLKRKRIDNREEVDTTKAFKFTKVDF